MATGCESRKGMIIGKRFLLHAMYRKNIMSAHLLEVSLLGVETVLS